MFSSEVGCWEDNAPICNDCGYCGVDTYGGPVELALVGVFCSWFGAAVVAC